MNYRKLRREISQNVHLTRPAEFALFTEWVGLRHAERIGDVGCGDGYWTSRLAGDERTVFGMDIDSDELLRARTFYGDSVAFLFARAEDLPLDDASLDIVTSISVLQHIPDDARALKEFHRVLRPRGKIYLTMDSLSLSWIPDSYRSFHSRRYGVRRFYTLPMIERLFEQAGFHLLIYRYLATSALSSWFIQTQATRGWNMNYLAPLSLPIAKLADSFSTSGQGGCYLAVAAERVG